jgi:ribonuclease D
MPDAIWIDRDADLPALAQTLESQAWIGVDTEFLRERTFFPKLCLLQLAAAGKIWCIDTLAVNLDAVMPALTAAAARKVIHAARQDLEAVYLSAKRVMTPVFDTQIAAGCIGLKPQIGYAELVKTLLDVTIPKGQTRTDWSKRPLSREQLEYAADDVLYLGEVADHLASRLRELGREDWAAEDCRSLEDKRLYEPDPAQAWVRLRGLAQLEPHSRGRAKTIAVWREKLARSRDLPRAWILADAAIFAIAQDSGSFAPLNDSLAASLRGALEDSPHEPEDSEPSQDARPTPEQKAVIERLGKIVDSRALELQISAEVLAPRGELKALVMGAGVRSDVRSGVRGGTPPESHVLSGWRRDVVGIRLLEAIA